jgi:hypothetical protein
VFNHHTSTAELPRNILELDFGLTTAETQMVTRLFGATPLTKRRDGKSADQLDGRNQKFPNHIQLSDQKDAVERNVLATEVDKPERYLERLA